MESETIAAVATAVGGAGISIVRVSGSQAVDAVDRIFSSKSGKKLRQAASHTIHFGSVVNQGEFIDEVLVSVMKEPHTYTREDVVEINCHGGAVVTNQILETVLLQGVRLAEPGEFTKRAFLNGRIDLSQAEAVMDVIQSKNKLALKSSIGQLKGSILTKIEALRESMLNDAAWIEAALDDPEHIEMEGFGEAFAQRVETSLGALEELLKSCDSGRMVKEGIRTVILGKPNAGKSSLLNALMGEERAIVTDIEGTTRDTLEESIYLGELALNLCDTAGIRDTSDYVEGIGVDRAKAAAAEADLILYVVDGTKALDKNDEEILLLLQGKRFLVLINKSDQRMGVDKKLLNQLTGQKALEISAKHRQGLEKLAKEIQQMFFQGKIDWNDQVYVTNIRHKQAIQEAANSLKEVLSSIQAQMPEDFYTIDLMNAYSALGKITGESVDEDLVNTIFGRFCMGK